MPSKLAADMLEALAEFDALPGISQTDAPFREVNPDHNAGHACGHHLFGAGSTAAAVAVKRWMNENDIAGTLRLYGTPAEEGGSGKVYMVRAGLFDDVDAVISWHAGDANQANPGTNLATISGKFRFTGRSAHAAAAPERGPPPRGGPERRARRERGGRGDGPCTHRRSWRALRRVSAQHFPAGSPG